MAGPRSAIQMWSRKETKKNQLEIIIIKILKHYLENNFVCFLYVTFLLQKCAQWLAVRTDHILNTLYIKFVLVFFLFCFYNKFYSISELIYVCSQGTQKKERELAEIADKCLLNRLLLDKKKYKYHKLFFYQKSGLF